MKTLGIILIIAAVGVLANMIYMGVVSNYQYSNTIFSNWSLADKASTIAQKAEYMDKFVAALQASGLQGTHSALYFPTPDNSFDQNFYALQSLQGRLHDIQKMDETSFAYQTAIQQITAQEQGEAQNMLDVFEGCWLKVHYYWLWNIWLVLLQVLLIIGLPIVGSVIISDN